MKKFYPVLQTMSFFSITLPIPLFFSPTPPFAKCFLSEPILSQKYREILASTPFFSYTSSAQIGRKEVIGMLVFFLNKKLKQLRSRLERSIFEEEYARLLGFGRLEKARTLGRIDGYRNIFLWLGGTEDVVDGVLKQAQEDAKKHDLYASILK